MNLYITENIDQAIEGFEIAPVLYGKVDLNIIPNNSANLIVAIDAIDSISSDFISTFIKNIRQKMRLGGKLTLGGTDLSIIAKNIINGTISGDDFNKLVYSKKGLYHVGDIVSILNTNNISIDSISIKGLNYEISASRNN